MPPCAFGRVLNVREESEGGRVPGESGHTPLQTGLRPVWGKYPPPSADGRTGIAGQKQRREKKGNEKKWVRKGKSLWSFSDHAHLSETEGNQRKTQQGGGRERGRQVIEAEKQRKREKKVERGKHGRETGDRATRDTSHPKRVEGQKGAKTPRGAL